MRNYVIINGVNSLDIQGLAINNLPPITKPMIRTQREEIDGRDGDIVTELGYSAYDKQIEIGLWGTYDINDIIKYFTGEGTITFSNEADKYYNFKILDQIDYEKLLKFKTATITFHCQPFKYPVEETPIEGEAIEISGSGSNITLENTVVAPMEMKLKGNAIQDGTPTPDNPVPIQVVSGDNSIEVCGKNLFDISKVITNWNSSNNTGVKNNNDGTLTITTTSGSSSMQATTPNKLKDYCPDLKVGDTVTFSMTTTGTNTYIYLYGTGANVLWSNNTSKTITQAMLDASPLWYASGVSSTATISNIQIEKGNQATTYEPYTGESYPISLGVENLLQFSQVIHNANGITITKNDDTILINGTATANVLPALNTIIGTGNTYNMSVKVISGSTTSTTSYIQTYVPGQVAISQKLNESGITSATLTNGTTYNNRINIPNGAVFNNLKIKVELTEGTNRVSTNPIELLKIGTYQDKIDKSSGKNLFDKDNTVVGWLRNTGTINPEAGSHTSDYIEIKPNTNYIRTTSEGNCYYDENKTFISYYYGKNIATPSNAKYLRMTVNDNYINNEMLNEGTTALPYEPYGTSWYVKKEIGKVVLDGSENWEIANSGTSSYFYRLALPDRLGTDGTNYLSNLFSNVIISSSNTDEGLYITSTNQLRIRYGVEDTIANWKTWLSTHNTEVYYVLATPTYTLIEDTTLINQLEALKPYSYNPVTNITQTNNDAPFELDVSLSYTDTMNVNNVGNIYAKPILELEGSGNIEVVLNDIQILEIDLGDGGKIAIDVPNLQAYDPDTDTLLNRLVTGDYMKLLIQEGDNTITFNGSVTSATLTKYTRWI